MSICSYFSRGNLLNGAVDCVVEGVGFVGAGHGLGGGCGWGDERKRYSRI